MQPFEQIETAQMLAQYREQGFVHRAGLISSTEVGSLLAALSTVAKESNRYGIRGLMARVPAIHALANTGPMPAIAREVLSEQARPVRSVYFDKLPEANWNVAWHQDTSIAVDGRADARLRALPRQAGRGPYRTAGGLPGQYADPAPAPRPDR